MSSCMKRNPQKLVPRGNFGQHKPQKFVLANLRKHTNTQNKKPSEISSYTV